MSIGKSFLFESLVTPKKISVFKSMVIDEYTLMLDGRSLGTFRNIAGEWLYYDGTLLMRFEKLSDLFAFVGRESEE